MSLNVYPHILLGQEKNCLMHTPPGRFQLFSIKVVSVHETLCHPRKITLIGQVCVHVSGWNTSKRII